MSAAKDQDWFCDGVAEEILNALSSSERSARRRPRIGVFVPRKRRRPENDRRQAAGRHRARRQRAPVGRSTAYYGAPLRCHPTAISYGRSATTAGSSGIFDVQEEIAKAVAGVSELLPTVRRSRTSSGLRKIKRRITSICADGISGIHDPRARSSGRENSSRKPRGRIRTTCCRG